MRRAKIVWTNTSGKANNPPPPTLPKHFGRFPSVSDFFKRLPKGYTEESYSRALVPGALFSLQPGTYVMNGVWTGSDAEVDQVSYVSRRAWNPSGQANVLVVQEQTACIYLEERRLTEWDGKGWARVIRPVFIVGGSIAAALSADTILPL